MSRLQPQIIFFLVICLFHAGAKVAQYAGEHLHKTIIDQMAYKRGDLTTAMRDAFLMIDNNMQNGMLFFDL